MTQAKPQLNEILIPDISHLVIEDQAYHPLARALSDLTDQYATGTLTAKIIRPAPGAGERVQ